MGTVRTIQSNRYLYQYLYQYGNSYQTNTDAEIYISFNIYIKLIPIPIYICLKPIYPLYRKYISAYTDIISLYQFETNNEYWMPLYFNKTDTNTYYLYQYRLYQYRSNSTEKIFVDQVRWVPSQQSMSLNYN